MLHSLNFTLQLKALLTSSQLFGDIKTAGGSLKYKVFKIESIEKSFFQYKDILG